jgi:hypothetical protein
MKTSNQILLEKFNDAFARGDTDFILEHVTDTIRWEIVGDQSAAGKEAFAALLQNMVMDEPMELTIHNIITHGKSAALNGIMKAANGAQFAFCDIYIFSGFKNPKIRQITSYALEV